MASNPNKDVAPSGNLIMLFYFFFCLSLCWLIDCFDYMVMFLVVEEETGGSAPKASPKRAASSLPETGIPPNPYAFSVISRILKVCLLFFY